MGSTCLPCWERRLSVRHLLRHTCVAGLICAGVSIFPRDKISWDESVRRCSSDVDRGRTSICEPMENWNRSQEFMASSWKQKPNEFENVKILHCCHFTRGHCFEPLSGKRLLFPLLCLIPLCKCHIRALSCFLLIPSNSSVHVDVVLQPWLGEIMFLRNVGIYIQVYTASQPRRTTSPSSPPWEPQISLAVILPFYISR
jgi:hypothetical protein